MHWFMNIAMKNRYLAIQKTKTAGYAEQTMVRNLLLHFTSLPKRKNSIKNDLGLSRDRICTQQNLCVLLNYLLKIA